MKTYLVVFLGSLFLAFIVTPLVVRLARALNVLDDPGVRKIHAEAVPRIGGIAIVFPLFVMTLPVFALHNQVGEEFRALQWEMTALLGGAALVFAVGLLDDIRGVRARIKFLVQFVAAAALCASGVLIERITISPTIHIDFGWFSYPLTILWIVGITNAVNLIDGLDGLAAGISLITCAVIGAIAIYVQKPVMGVFMLGLVGSLIGFLFYNFNPAKIFLGDCGSLFLGFFLAASSVATSHKTSTILALALPAVALGVPIFDTLLSMVRRLLDRRPLFAPDRGHIHHRLLEKGFDQRKAVLVLYAVTAAACGVGLLMVFVQDVGQVVLFTLALIFVLVFFQISGAFSVRRALRKILDNQVIAREMNHGRDALQVAELRLREATTFAHWWEALSEAAEALAFTELSLRPEGPTPRVGTVVWRRRGVAHPGERVVTFASLVHDEHGAPLARLEGVVRRGRSYEAAARRAALLGRLLDQKPVPTPDAAAPGGVGSALPGALPTES